jgi:hypothetical protein
LGELKEKKSSRSQEKEREWKRRNRTLNADVAGIAGLKQETRVNKITIPKRRAVGNNKEREKRAKKNDRRKMREEHAASC